MKKVSRFPLGRFYRTRNFSGLKVSGIDLVPDRVLDSGRKFF